MSDHDNHEDHEDHGEEQNPGLVKKNRQLLSEAKQSRARADPPQPQQDAALVEHHTKRQVETRIEHIANSIIKDIEFLRISAGLSVIDSGVFNGRRLNL